MPEGEFQNFEVRRQLELEQRIAEFGGRADTRHSFLLGTEKDKNGDVIPADVTWVRFVDREEEPVIEGKLYVPKQNAKQEVVIINPGLPGDGIGLLEERYVPEMIKNGYSVFSSRHNGIYVDASSQDKYIHCPEKKLWAGNNDEECIGEPFCFERASREVFTAIKALEEQFQKIHFVGHSGGVLNIMRSLGHLSGERKDLTGKIGNLVSLSGVVGEYDVNLMRDILQQFQEKKLMNVIPDLEENLRQFEEAMLALKDIDWSQFPHFSTMFITPTKLLGGTPDEYVSPDSIQHFADFMKGQGCERVRVVDYSNRKVKAGDESHDFKNLSAGITMRWITGEGMERLSR